MSKKYPDDGHDWEEGEFEDADREFGLRCRDCGIMCRMAATPGGNTIPVYSHAFMAGCDMRVVRSVMES